MLHWYIIVDIFLNIFLWRINRYAAKKWYLQLRVAKWKRLAILHQRMVKVYKYVVYSFHFTFQVVTVLMGRRNLVYVLVSLTNVTERYSLHQWASLFVQQFSTHLIAVVAKVMVLTRQHTVLTRFSVCTSHCVVDGRESWLLEVLE